MTIAQLQHRYPRTPKRRSNRLHALAGSPQRRGTCLKVFTTTPRKPNSAVRKVARVLLSNYKRVTVYIPGMTHNLQRHSAVFVRAGRVKDLPGVKYTMIRGKLDLQRIPARRKGRSKYGSRLVHGEECGPYHKTKIW